MNKIIKQLIKLSINTQCDKNQKRCSCEEFDYIIDQLKNVKEKLERCNKLINDPKHSENEDSPHYFSDGETIDYISLQLDKILDVDVYDDKFDKEIQEIKRIENE
jgi:hypothetical protein